MSDEERHYAMQDATATENDPAFGAGYEAGERDGRMETLAACAALCRKAEPEILELLKQHNWDMNRPNGRQTWYSQREYAGKIANALASRIEARGAERRRP